MILVVPRSVAELLDPLAMPPSMGIGLDSRIAVRLLPILVPVAYQLRAWFCECCIDIYLAIVIPSDSSLTFSPTLLPTAVPGMEMAEIWEDV